MRRQKNREDELPAEAAVVTTTPEMTIPAHGVPERARGGPGSASAATKRPGEQGGYPEKPHEPHDDAFYFRKLTQNQKNNHLDKKIPRSKDLPVEVMALEPPIEQARR